MSFLTQKPTSTLALLGAGLIAAGLALFVLRTSPWGGFDSAEGGLRGSSKDGSINKGGGRGGGDSSARSGKGGKHAAGQDGGIGSLVPRGLGEIDGEGGEGNNRAVLKDGVWFPVLSPTRVFGANVPLDESALGEVPLSITSGSPPPGKTGTPFVFDFEAIGGAAPYAWSYQIAESRPGFVMDVRTGFMSGLSNTPLQTVLEVFVIDSAGARDSARYPLVIEEPLPLAVATNSLSAATMGTTYLTQLSATGGKPPYFWTVTGLEAAGLAVTANTGELTGIPASVGDHILQVKVVDQAEGSAAATLTLTVKENSEEDDEDDESKLRITTATLPEAAADAPYQAQLAGAGGTAPYVWRFASSLPEGLVLDASTGAISGTPKHAGEFALQAVITDTLGAEAMRSFTLKVANGLEIANTSPLLPTLPGMPYQLTFTATGGTAPYAWRVGEGALPSSWTLSLEGVLTGVAPPGESTFRFAIEVQDSAGRTFSKSFELSVRQGLVVVPSAEKAGLAWRPQQIDANLRASGAGLVAVALVRGVGGFPQAPGAGVLVYQGTGNNAVDRNLPTGGTFFYTLFALTADGRALPYTTAATTILPITLQRGQPGVSGDPFADRVPSFQPLRAGGYGAANVPANITGPPDGKGTLIPASLPTEVASLHAKTGAGGSVVLEFTDNIVDLGPGADFSVFENVFFVGGNSSDRFMEPAIVWVALFEGEWFRFPIDVVPPAAGQPLKLNDPFYYNRGFAGRNPTTGSDPTNPNASGGDPFDANTLGIPGLTWIRYVMIQSAGDNSWVDDFGGDPVRHTSNQGALSGGGTSGFDLDGVSAVNY